MDDASGVAPETGVFRAGRRSDAVGATPGPESIVSEKPRGEAGPGYWLRENNVLVRFRALPAPCPVVLLSPAMAWIEPDYHTDYPFNERVEVFLQHEGRSIGPVSATLSLEPLGKRGPLVGLQFRDVSPTIGREILDALRELTRAGAARPASVADLHGHVLLDQARANEIISQPERIRSVLTALVKSKGVVSRSGGGSAPMCVRLLDLQNDVVRWEAPEGWSGGATVEVIGYNSVFRFSVAAHHLRSGDIVSPVPPRIERVRQRIFRRAEVSDDITVTYVHPLWSDLPPVRSQVLDVSFSGIRIAARKDHLLYAGLRVALEVKDGDGASIQLRGEVRSVAQDAQGAFDICGMMVAPCSHDDDREWTRLVSRVLYGAPRDDVAWSEELWDIFTTSGYFNLSGKKPEHFDALKRSFFSVAKKAAEVPYLMYNATWSSERDLEGTVSIMKAYSGSWMLHQLAKRPRPSSLNVSSRRVMRDIYTRCFEHAQADPELRWTMAYAEAGVAWNDRSHFEFARRHAETGLVMTLPFRLMEADTATLPTLPAELPEPLDIGPATAAEQALLLHVLAKSRPRGYVDALDLVPERFAVPVFGSSWRRAGIERERAVLVARRHGDPVAAAILELGEVGTNLFRLLDSVRLVSMAAGGQSAYASLLEESRLWFARHDRPSFVYLCEESRRWTAGANLRDLGAGVFWAIAADLVPDFVEHIYEITAPKRNVPG